MTARLMTVVAFQSIMLLSVLSTKLKRINAYCLMGLRASSTSHVCAQTAKQELCTVAELPGNFPKKIVKRRDYRYYQTADLTGKQIQIFVGLASAELTNLIAVHRSGGGKTVHLRQLARQAIAAGCLSIVPAHAKILGRLSDAGFFRAGGILMGTHVYMAYQNYLGIRWDFTAQTLEPDFAHAG